MSMSAKRIGPSACSSPLFRQFLLCVSPRRKLHFALRPRRNTIFIRRPLNDSTDGFSLDCSYIGETRDLFEQLDVDGVTPRGRWLETVLICLLVCQVVASAMAVSWSSREDEYSWCMCCYCFAPLYFSFSGEEQYRNAIDGLRMQQPMSFRPTSDIAGAASFAFGAAGLTAVVQAVVLSAIVGMTNEAIVNGSTTKTAEELLGTSAILFALSLANTAYTVMTTTEGYIGSLTGTAVVASRQHVQALKERRGDGDDDSPDGCTTLAQYTSKSRVRLRDPIGQLPRAAGIAAVGALMLAVAMGSSYYDIAVAFEQQDVVPDAIGRRRMSTARDVAWGDAADGAAVLRLDSWHEAAGAPDSEEEGFNHEGVHGLLQTDGTAWEMGAEARVLQGGGTNSTGNKTALSSVLDRESALVLRNVLAVRVSSLFLAVGWAFWVGLLFVLLGVLGCIEQSCCKDDGIGDGLVALGTFAGIGAAILVAFVFLMVGLVGVGIVGGLAFTGWVARSFFQSLATFNLDEEEVNAEGISAALLVSGLRCCMPRIVSDEELHQGADTESQRIIRRLHEPLYVANWACRGVCLSALLDVGLGVYAMLNATLFDALRTELIEGYEIGIVCGLLGIILNGLALPLLVYVWCSGVLSMTKEQDGDMVGEQLDMSYDPASLSLVEAAVLRMDGDVLHIFNNMNLLKQKSEAETSDGGVGMLDKDEGDPVEVARGLGQVYASASGGAGADKGEGKGKGKGSDQV